MPDGQNYSLRVCIYFTPIMGPLVRINRGQIKKPSIVGFVKISSASLVVISVGLGHPTRRE
jgi:hypothetical protein